MAALIRNIVKFKGRNIFSLSVALRGAVRESSIKPVCFIHTSNKIKDAVTVTEKLHEAKTATATKKFDADSDENWISYGYSLVDREEDEWAHHMIMFTAITIVICWGSLILAYFPDFKDVAWAQREAYLELTRREQAGLPLIDANLVDPNSVVLPTDEELGDFEIII